CRLHPCDQQRKPDRQRHEQEVVHGRDRELPACEIESHRASGHIMDALWPVDHERHARRVAQGRAESPCPGGHGSLVDRLEGAFSAGGGALDAVSRAPASQRPAPDAYVCAPPTMVDAAAEVARDGGVKDDNIILERYLPTG